MFPSSGQLEICFQAVWSRMPLSRMTWLCCFLIIQQAGQDSSHIGDSVPNIDTGIGRKLGCFYNSFTPVFCSQSALSSNTSSTTFKLYGLDQVTCLCASVSSSVKWRYDWSYINLIELLWAVNECKLLRTVYRKHSIFAGCYQRTKPQKSIYIVRNLLSLVAQELKPSLQKGYLWDQSFESLANWFIDDYMGNWEWRLISQ